MKFTQKEKLAHYTAVANGSKATKSDGKFNEAEQRAYARGQRDARNESKRIFASKKATAEQKAMYKAKRKSFNNRKKRS